MSDDSSKQKPQDHKHRKQRVTGHWGSWAAIVISVVALALGQVFGGLVVGVAAAIASAFALIQIDTWFDTTPAQFMFVLLSSVSTIFVLWVFLRHRKINWSTLGFRRKPQWIDLGLATAAAPAYLGMLIVASAFAGLFLGVDLQQKQELGFEQVVGIAPMLLTFVSLVIIPPIVEEILFRGFLYTGLRHKLPVAWAAIITSMLFAIPHLFASSNGLLWIAAIDTLVLSLVLCYLRERSGNLWAPILLHAIKNGAAFTFAFVISQ